MKGTFLHNHVIAATLVKVLRLRGHRVHLEYPIHHGQRSRAVDVYFQSNGHWFAIEIECTTARIPNDVAKAEVLRPDLFLIVTPNARLARSSKSVLGRLLKNSTLPAGTIRIMPFGAALQWVANNCPVMSTSNVINRVGHF